MKKWAIFLIFWGFLAFVIQPPGCFAQEAGDEAAPQGGSSTLSRPDLGVTFRYPNKLEKLSPPTKETLLLLRPNGARFPSINVLMQPGNPKVEEKSVAELRRDVVDSYRKVGLIEAESKFSEKRNRAGRTVFYTEISYPQDKIDLMSAVYIIPAQGEYYIVTQIDNAQGFKDNLNILESIVGSFTLRDPPPQPEKKPLMGQWGWYLGAGAILLLIIAAVYFTAK